MKDSTLSAPAHQITAPQDSAEIDLTELIRTLWRGKFWIALCVFIAIVLGGYYAFFKAVPVYTSSAVVMLESRQEQVVDLESVMTGLSGDQATINTEVEVIRSRGLIEKLVNKLNLMEDPEFNPALRPPRVFSPGRIINQVREMISGEPTAVRQPHERESLDAVIDSVINTISITNLRQSYVFEITAATKDREKSAAIANTLASLYILEQIEVKFAATEQATEWLSERVGQLQVELETAVAKVKEFNSGTALISPEALVGLNRQLKETRDRLREAQQSKATATARMAELEAVQATGTPEEIAEVANDTTLTRILRVMEDGNRKAFDTRFSQVLERAQLDVTRADSQITALESSIKTQDAQIERQSADLVRLQQLEREAEASRLIYEYFLNRLKETSIQQGIQQADSRVLSQAVVPLRPSSPRKPLILALSMVLGLLIGAAIVLIREFAQNTYRVAEDLEAKTGYSVLGQIPAIPARKRKNVLKYLSDKPTSAAAEAIRNLRTSVLLSNLDQPPKIIMSTSSIPGEGKTTQSIALTQNLARMDKKVLLIEGDMRRRIFAEYFDIKDRKGLISVLSGDMEFSNAVIREPALQADLLIAEKTTTNPADVFSTERFRSFLDNMREKYDYIIIDTPPVLAVPDARVIGQCVDAIIYTVKWDSTSQRQVLEGLRAFESVNVRVAGLVLAQISASGMKRYGYGDSYGAYSSYYDS
ncbi:polysaccharide biosynthesis tyrosine autokinase (plasmid) [Pseudohalocynthiibacter aestuariivivens]|nr:polysaccharide biosynthesis tyrosine autokinase [Pseudohalocynthiibacter aestuariivivens]QIE47908.1 polysaccharide biosynthesis tyrosine autokinase [Pseudohalocynthiibacter aestuariivivens]